VLHPVRNWDYAIVYRGPAGWSYDTKIFFSCRDEIDIYKMSSEIWKVVYWADSFFSKEDRFRWGHHRIDGPAIEDSEGRREFWYRGARFGSLAKIKMRINKDIQAEKKRQR